MLLVREEEEKVSRTRCAPAPGGAPCQPHRLGPIPTSPQKDVSPCPERVLQDQSDLPTNLQEAKTPGSGERDGKPAGFI